MLGLPTCKIIFISVASIEISKTVIQGLKLMQSTQKNMVSKLDGKERTGRPINMKQVFRKLTDDISDDPDGDDRDELADLELKIR